MASTRLLQTACTIALLAAAPAFAQTNSPTGDTSAAGAPNNPTAHEAMPNSSAAPTDKMGSHAAMDEHSTHRMAMAHHHGRNASSQDSAVDQLNEQSYQAARSGQAFNAGVAAPTPSDTGTGAAGNK